MNHLTNITICLLIAFQINLVSPTTSFAQESTETNDGYTESGLLDEGPYAEDTVYKPEETSSENQ